jgi:hypothetical protein
VYYSYSKTPPLIDQTPVYNVVRIPMQLEPKIPLEEIPSLGNAGAYSRIKVFAAETGAPLEVALPDGDLITVTRYVVVSVRVSIIMLAMHMPLLRLDVGVDAGATSVLCEWWWW